MISATFDSTEIIRLNLDRPTRSIRLIQTDRTSEDQLWEKRRSAEIQLTERFVFVALNLTFNSTVELYPFGSTQIVI